MFDLGMVLKIDRFFDEIKKDLEENIPLLCKCLMLISNWLRFHSFLGDNFRFVIIITLEYRLKQQRGNFREDF